MRLLMRLPPLPQCTCFLSFSITANTITPAILPGWGAAEREEARIRGEQELWIEPPVMEYISAKLYALAGDADLRLPRALAILFWLIGAAGLNIPFILLQYLVMIRLILR